MKVVAFLTEHAVVDRIIHHLELTFVAEKPPPAAVRAAGSRVLDSGLRPGYPPFRDGKGRFRVRRPAISARKIMVPDEVGEHPDLAGLFGPVEKRGNVPGEHIEIQLLAAFH